MTIMRGRGGVRSFYPTRGESTGPVNTFFFFMKKTTCNLHKTFTSRVINNLQLQWSDFKNRNCINDLTIDYAGRKNAEQVSNLFGSSCKKRAEEEASPNSDK